MRVSIRLQRRLLIMFLVVFALGSMVSQVEAAESVRGDRCSVDADAVIEDDFYFFCRIMDVRGTINGDLVGVASSVTIYPTARIAGDVWVAGGKLVIEGRVGDDIRFGGVSLVVQGQARLASAEIDVVSVALNTEIAESAVLPGDLLSYGYQARIDGTVSGDVKFSGEALLINGVVAGRVEASVGDPRRNTDVPSLPFYNVSFFDPGLLIAADAFIEGDLEYRSATPNLIPPGVVNGRTRFRQTGGQPDITKVERPDDAAEILSRYFVTSFRDVLTLVILGAVSLRVFPAVVRQPAQHVRRRTVPTIGWGLLTFMLSIPVIITVFVLGLIVVLILYLIKLNELTFMLGAGVLITTAGLVAGISFLLFFMGRLVVSFMIGQLLYRYVLRIVEPGSFRRWLVMLALGSVTYALITNMPLPAFGIIIELVTALAGVGAVIMYLRRLLLDSNLFAPRIEHIEPVPVTTITVPEIDRAASDVPPGLDNLPEGFTGFDEDW